MTIDIGNNSNVANINGKLEKVISYWLQLTKPFNNLIDSEIAVLSRILYYRTIYAKNISDETALNIYTLSTSSRAQIKNSLTMDTSRFEIHLSNLRKKGIIIGKDGFNKAYIPNIDLDTRSYKVLFNFNIIDAEE